MNLKLQDSKTGSQHSAVSTQSRNILLFGDNSAVKIQHLRLTLPSRRHSSLLVKCV